MAVALLLALPSMAADLPPDLTRGGKPDNEHRWTLGATGARGGPSRRILGPGQYDFYEVNPLSQNRKELGL
jgi:hypothetical protein